MTERLCERAERRREDFRWPADTTESGRKTRGSNMTRQQEMHGRLCVVFEWLSLHSRHSPACERVRQLIPQVTRSGLAKDFGGRYASDEEMRAQECSCGLDKAHTELNTVCAELRALNPDFLTAVDALRDLVGRMAEEIERLRQPIGSALWHDGHAQARALLDEAEGVGKGKR